MEAKQFFAESCGRAAPNDNNNHRTLPDFLDMDPEIRHKSQKYVLILQFECYILILQLTIIISVVFLLLGNKSLKIRKELKKHGTIKPNEMYLSFHWG